MPDRTLSRNHLAERDFQGRLVTAGSRFQRTRSPNHPCREPKSERLGSRPSRKAGGRAAPDRCHAQVRPIGGSSHQAAADRSSRPEGPDHSNRAAVRQEARRHSNRLRQAAAEAAHRVPVSSSRRAADCSGRPVPVVRRVRPVRPVAVVRRVRPAAAQRAPVVGAVRRVHPVAAQPAPVVPGDRRARPVRPVAAQPAPVVPGDRRARPVRPVAVVRRVRQVPGNSAGCTVPVAEPRAHTRRRP
jgi:hypothetical protein